METVVLSGPAAAHPQEKLELDNSLNQHSMSVTSVIDQVVKTASEHTVKCVAGNEAPTPQVKRRGRPPKNKQTNEPVVKRKRGRPRKNPLPVITVRDNTQPVNDQRVVPASQEERNDSNEKITVEKLAINTAIQQSGLSKQNVIRGDKSTADTSMNTINQSPKKRGRPRKRPLETDIQPPLAKRSKETVISPEPLQAEKPQSPMLLQAEKAQLLFSLPECEVTKARVDIDLVAGPGSFDQHTATTPHTVVVNLKENSPDLNEAPPTAIITIAKRGRGRPPKKKGRGRPSSIAAAMKEEPATKVKRGRPPSKQQPSADVKRSIGRPRKYPLPSAMPTQDTSSTATPPKRKRGRPPKKHIVQPPAPESGEPNGARVTKELEETKGEAEPKRGRGRPKLVRPKETVPTENKPKRGRGRPRKNVTASISQLAEQILLAKSTPTTGLSEDPLPSVGGVVLQHVGNGQGVVTVKRKRGRPRKHPLPTPKTPEMKKRPGRPRLHPPPSQPSPEETNESPSSPPITPKPLAPLVSPMLGTDIISPQNKFSEPLKVSAGIQTTGTVTETSNEGFKLHMSFSDSDSEASEGMGVQDTDIQALAERVVPPSPKPPTGERDSPLLGSGFEESFDEDSDTEANK